MAIANLAFNINTATTQFHQAAPQTQLQVLHFLGKQLNKASKAAAPSAFFSQRVQSVLKQIHQLPREESSQALQDILTRVPTRVTEAYEGLDANMRMAFWYRLANSDRGDLLLAKAPMKDENGAQVRLMDDLESRDSNELVSFFHEAVNHKSFVQAY